MRGLFFYGASVIFVVGLIALDLALLYRNEDSRALLEKALDEQIAVDYQYRGYALDLEWSGPVLEFEGLRLTRSRGSSDPAFECDAVRLGLGWDALFEGKAELDDIELVNPVIHLYWNKKGELDLRRLFNDPGGDQRAFDIPNVDVTGLAVSLHAPPFFSENKVVVIRPIDINVSPNVSKQYPYAFEGQIDDAIFGRFLLDGNFGANAIQATIQRENFQLEERLVDLFREDVRGTLQNVDAEGGINLVLRVDSTEFLETVNFSLSAEARDLVLRHRDYPTRITDLQGSFELVGERLSASLLQFDLEGAAVDVREGWVDFGARGGARGRVMAEVRGLDIGPEFSERLNDLDSTFDDIREALEAFGTRGAVDADLELLFDPSGRVGVEAEMRFDGVSMAWNGYEEDGQREGYPYRVNDLYGVARIWNDGIEVFDLRTRSNDQDVSMSGKVSFGREPLGFDVAIRGEFIPLDGRVAEALPASERAIYESYAAKGFASVYVDIERPKGAEDSKVTVSVDLGIAEAKPTDFPLDLRDVEGRLIFKTGEAVQLVNIRGRRGEGELFINGQATLGDEGSTLRLEGDRLVLDEEFLEALTAQSAELAAEVRSLKLRGLFDINCDLVDGNAQKIDVVMKGMSARLDTLASVPLEDIWGELHVESRRIDLKKVRLRAAGRPFSVQGHVDVAREKPAIDLILEGSDLSIDDDWLALVGEEVEEVNTFASQWRAHGRAKMKIELIRNRRGDLTTSDFWLDGFEIRDRNSALVINDVNGHLRIKNGDVFAENFSALVPWRPDWRENPAGRASLALESASRKESEGGLMEFRGLSVRNFVAAPEVYELVPKSWRGGLDDLGFRGRIDADLEQLRIQGEEIDFRGLLKLEGVHLIDKKQLLMKSGDFAVTDGEITGGGFDIKGRLDKAHIAYEGFEFEEFKSPLLISNEGIEFQAIAASIVGGRTRPEATRMRVDFDEGLPFSIDARATELDLTRIIAASGGRSKDIQGRANLGGRMSGRFEDLSSYTGEARIRMAGRRLYELPFFATVFEIINFDFLTTSENAPQRGDIMAKIKTEAVHIESARFEGRGINLDGRGKIGFDGIVKFEFEPKPIKWVDSLPIVGELFRIGSGIIVDRVHISGPIEKTTARVGNYITEILPGKEDSGRRLIIRPIKEKGVKP